MFSMKRKISILTKVILFIVILGFLFSRVTYLFRLTSTSRDNITGLEQEENLDVICIGASTLIEYYQPLVAWEQYGYTSYAYATVYGPIDFYYQYIDKVLQTHKPDLFVVDIRTLTTMTEEVLEPGVRYWADSLPVFSKNRWISLYEYMQTHTLNDTDSLTSYYFDIAKYHNNTQVLGIPEQWKDIDNDNESQYKGHELSAVHRFFDEPDAETEKKGELSKRQADVLYNLLDYCKEQELEVLFVVCPYYIYEDEQEIYNAAADIIASYGYEFLNANEHYSDMQLDFATDIKNVNHVNCLGAEKYTLFLGDYIKKSYEIENHKGDSSYAKWDEDSVLFRQELDKQKELVYQTIEDKYAAVDLAKEMIKMEDAYEWSINAKNSNYTAIVCGNLDKSRVEEWNEEGRNLLEYWGIGNGNQKYFLQVSSGDAVSYTEDTDQSIDYYGNMGVTEGLAPAQYEVHVDDNIRLIVEGTDYSLGNDGVNILIFDNNFKKVVDSVILRLDKNDVVTMERES